MNCLIGISGLGDWWSYSIQSVKSSENAEYLTWCLACEQYESYVGSYGIRDIDTIMEEDECTYEDALEIFKDEREMWVDYWFSFEPILRTNQQLQDAVVLPQIYSKDTESTKKRNALRL